MESPSFLVWIGFAAFFFVSLIVGVRLLLLARRTRELPELLIGVGVLGIGPVGFGCSVVGTALVTQRPEIAGVAFVLGSLAISAGVLAKFVFNWRVYHPRSELARGLVGLVALLLLGVTAYRSFWYGFAPGDPSAAPQLVQSGLLIGALLWGSFEAIRYWLLMKRRAKLGFADAVVANRFFLWGLGAGAAGLGAGLGTVVGMVTGMSQMQVPWVVASSSAHGFVAAVAISLAFVPPGAYVRWVAGRDAA
jgi:hypothetical protein